MKAHQLMFLAMAAISAESAYAVHTTYRWRVTNRLVYHASPDVKATIPDLDQRVVIHGYDEFRGQIVSDLVVTTGPDSISFRGSVPYLDTSKKRLDLMPFEGEYTSDHILVTGHDPSNRSPKAKVVYVSASDGPIGSILSPFADNYFLRPELLAFLIGLDPKQLYRLPWREPKAGVLYATNEADGKLASTCLSYKYEFTFKVDPKTGRPLEETSRELNVPSHTIKALRFEDRGDKRVATQISCDSLDLNRKIGEQHAVYDLVEVSESAPLKIDIPLGSSVLDYRLAGPNISHAAMGQWQPNVYAWDGKLPQLSSLSKKQEHSDQDTHPWIYVAPLSLLIAGGCLAWWSRSKSLAKR